MALREQNAHIQRKVASGEGGEDILEGSEAQQKVHGKVSDADFKIMQFGIKPCQGIKWMLCPDFDVTEGVKLSI